MSRSSLFEQTTPVGLKVSDTSPQINIEFSDQVRSSEPKGQGEADIGCRNVIFARS